MGGLDELAMCCALDVLALWLVMASVAAYGIYTSSGNVAAWKLRVSSVYFGA